VSAYYNISVTADGSVLIGPEEFAQWQTWADEAGMTVRDFLEAEPHLFWNHVDWQTTDVFIHAPTTTDVAS
jgi:hypothetical protein